MKYMESRCGAWPVGNDPTRGAVAFRIFFPAGPDPYVSSIRVCCTFQDQAWDFTHAPQMTMSVGAEGVFWSYTAHVELPAAFYEYKCLITFDGSETRCVR